MKAILFVVSLMFCSQTWAFDVGSDFENSICTKNCKADLKLNLKLKEQNSSCTHQFIDSHSVRCCRKIADYSKLSDQQISDMVWDRKNMGSCTMELGEYSDIWSLCNAETCIDIDNSAKVKSLADAYRSSNREHLCEQTHYANGVLLFQGERIFINEITYQYNKKFQYQSLEATCD